MFIAPTKPIFGKFYFSVRHVKKDTDHEEGEIMDAEAQKESALKTEPIPGLDLVSMEVDKPAPEDDGM